MNERNGRTARAWILGILGILAISALAISAAFTPEALAEGAPIRLVGLEPHHCPGCPLCGMSRAFSCVTHAHFSRAVEFNAGVLLAYPAAALLACIGPLALAGELWKRSQ
jgi:hypothetical protein